MKPTKTIQRHKGLVMAIDQQTMTVMTPAGEFLKTRFQGHELIGDEVEFELEVVKETVRAREKRYWISAHRGLARVAAAVMTVAMATGASWAIPVGQVYMDVNPSLGLSYNIYERVIGVKGYNSDGVVIEKALSVYGKSIEESVAASLTLMDEKGYVKANQGGVILGYTSDNEKVKTAAVNAVTTVVEKVEKPLSVAEVTVNTQDESQAKTDETSPIKAALENKTAKPVVNEKLNAVQKRLLEEQKRLEELKKKSENLNQKIEAAASAGKLPPKAEKASQAKQAALNKQIAAAENVVDNLADKANALGTNQQATPLKKTQNEVAIAAIAEESNNLEEDAGYQAAAPNEKLAIAIKVHEKLLALREKLISGGVDTEMEKNRLKQLNIKIKQLENLIEKAKEKKQEQNKDKDKDKEENLPKKDKGKKP